MKWVLRLYPQAWQRRYRAEVEQLLEDDRTPFRTTLDLLAGAFDARLNRRWLPQLTETDEDIDMLRASRCGSIEISRKDATYSAALMIGITLVLTVIALILDKSIGPHIAIDALLMSAFFIALTISSRRTYLKPYSAAATNGMIALFCIGWYLFFLGAYFLGTLI